MATKEQVLSAIGYLVAGFPSANLSEDAVEAYLVDLEDLENEHLVAAVRELRRGSRWLPSIADIRTRAVEIAAEQHRRRREERLRADLDAGRSERTNPETLRKIRELVSSLGSGMQMPEES